MKPSDAVRSERFIKTERGGYRWYWPEFSVECWSHSVYGTFCFCIRITEISFDRTASADAGFQKGTINDNG